MFHQRGSQPVPEATTRRPSIALVVPHLSNYGGIEATARFLHKTIEESGRYRADVISLATSYRDSCSLRMLDPTTWPRGARVGTTVWHDRQVPHVGCHLAELEFQRYRPRRALTQLLAAHDLVQIVAGSPAWGLIARDCERPVALQVAALAKEERRLAQARSSGPLAWWRALMIAITHRLDNIALRQVQTVFVINQHMQQWAQQRVALNSVVLAPQGVDTNRFRPGETRSGRRYLLSVGRLADPRKNVRLLFQAYRTLLDDLPDAPDLVLAGRTGPTPEDWRFAESLGIRARVTLRQGLAEDELARLYREAELFVLTADQEGLGIVILEAMASGLPVVGTDCVGPRICVQDGESGFLVENGDAPALARRMRELLSNPALAASMGQAGRQAAMTRFSLEATGRRYLERYDRMLAEPLTRKRTTARRARHVAS